MYRAPDFIKVGLKVKTAFANTSSCPFDEGTDYTKGSGSMDVCDGTYASYISRMEKGLEYLCYSTRNE